ncbi:choline dehydrogenase [Xylariaceae sp. FL0804]|nr:choline dehydrogenase [Xylariaceae sp. FL0804]
MKSFSYLALLSALAPFSEAAANTSLPNGSGAYGVNYLTSRTPTQDNAIETGPVLSGYGPPSPNKTYEYVVVGSGPGGGPLAAYLAMAGYSTLLIDAGGDYGNLREVDSPALSFSASEKNEVAWGFFAHHYTNTTQALRDRKLTWMTPEGDYYSGVYPPEGSEVLGNYYPRYGGLGGCAEHNALVGVLPSADDWNYIKNITGDAAWGAENMRELWKGIENLQYPVPEEYVKDHGDGGWQDMSIAPPGIDAQDLKVMQMIIGASKGLNISTDAISTAIQEATAQYQTETGEEIAEKLLPLNMTYDIQAALADMLQFDINNDSPTRDSTPFWGRLPLIVDAENNVRSTGRGLIYDVATAKNLDGSKKYPLDIALHTLVTKVNFDTSASKPKATGVDFLVGESLYHADPRSNLTDETKGTPGSIKASREVIVSGGTFNTPQILKLSGVGAKEELQKFDIPVVVDLPGVGTNMQDRLEIGVAADASTNYTRTLACTYLGTADDPCWDQYTNPNLTGAAKGTYATNGLPAGWWGLSSYAEGVQDLWIGGFPALFQGFYPGFSVNAATASDKTHWSWLVLKAHTKNTAGTVTLKSANPRDTPEINFHNTYEGETKADADADTYGMLEGMKLALSFFEKTVPLEGTIERIWPPNDVQTDEELHQWIVDEAWGHHASCSCPIGADDDPMAVLDGQFRVRGTDGLRVVDASAFPKIPGTFPTIPIQVMGQKAVQDILQDAKNSK